MHFGDLRFIINLEGGLERVCSPGCSVDTTSSNFIVDCLRGLWLDAPGANALTRLQLPSTGRADLEQEHLKWQPPPSVL